jgi:hypothetical protein
VPLGAWDVHIVGTNDGDARGTDVGLEDVGREGTADEIDIGNAVGVGAVDDAVGSRVGGEDVGESDGADEYCGVAYGYDTCRMLLFVEP